MNGLAVTSFVLGLLWLFWLGSVLGFVFGVVSIRQIRRSGGTQRGMTLAVLGVVLSALWLLLLVLGIVGTVLVTPEHSS
jgi:uncharacterized membrane protein